MEFGNEKSVVTLKEDRNDKGPGLMVKTRLKGNMFLWITGSNTLQIQGGISLQGSCQTKESIQDMLRWQKHSRCVGDKRSIPNKD